MTVIRATDMQYIDFGKRSGFRVPRVNFGSMRLPDDYAEATALIRQAIDAGMVYIDASRYYNDCELKLAQALKDGYRGRVILSTKSRAFGDTPWEDVAAEATLATIREQMERLEVDHLDFYQVWSINSRDDYEGATRPGGMLDGMRRAVDLGLVGHLGFTTHAPVDTLLDIIDEIDWCEIILFTYNMINRTYGPAIAAAHQRGIGTVLMNPVGGGKLGEDSPKLAGLAATLGCKNVADMAIRWLFANPNVDTIITGVGKPSDIHDSIASANAGPLSAEAVRTIDALVDEITQEAQAFCTACKYCMPCPQGVNIPAIMSIIQDQRYWGFQETAQRRYQRLDPGTDAASCTQCGECLPKCTQHLPIPSEMGYAHQTWGNSSA